MNRGWKFKIARVFNVPIYLDWTLLLLLLYFVFTNGGHFFVAVFSLVFIFASVLLHELGHTAAALSFGCRVRDINLTFIGGCATLLDMPREPWKEFAVAIAGPLVSLALWRIPILMGLTSPHLDRNLFDVLSWINRMLFLFNLVPAFPMDGGRIFRSVLSSFLGRLRASFIAYRLGQVLAVCMGIYALIHDFDITLIFIAYFIYVSAKAEYQALLNETGSSFGGKPPDDAAIISPPPYGGHNEVSDVFKER